MRRPASAPPRGVPVALAALAALAALGAGRAALAAPGKYRVETKGRVEGVRAADLDGDGRLDLVVLLAVEAEGRTHQELLLLRTPATPVRGRFFDAASDRRIRVDTPALRAAGAVAVGQFGPGGATRLRFLGRDGMRDLDPSADMEPSAMTGPPTLLGRSPGRPLVFWDGHADLDHSGREAIWFPLDDESRNALHVASGEGGGPTLDLGALSRGVTDDRHRIRRHAYVPRLVPADLDGDGTEELVAWQDGTLIAWSVGGASGAASLAPAVRIPLPFVRTDLGPDEVHTPRIQLADVDQDGVTDLLVTLVTGDRRQIGSFRTRLLHFPGPFVDPASGGLVSPRARIDTESVTLHPRFTDLDGDGDLDYVGDAIRGTKLDLVRRVMGADPTIWHFAFLFDSATGTFESVPWFSIERPYSGEEALSNRFGRSGFFEGDFDGDGRNDLLDLGDLGGVEIWKAAPRRQGPGDPVVFEEALVPRVKIPPGARLVGDAVIADLDGDGVDDAVLWSEGDLYLVVSGTGR